MSWLTILAEDEQGNRHEVLVSRDAMPCIGDFFEDEGQSLRRIPSTTRVHVTRYSHVKAHDRPIKRDVDQLGLTPAPHYDEKGVACFESRREIDDYIARVNDNPREGRTLAWNPDGNE